MSIEANKKDFEEALKGLVSHMDDLDDRAHPDLVEAIKSISDEYNSHFKGDIESLVDEKDALSDKLLDLEQKIQSLESELEGD